MPVAATGSRAGSVTPDFSSLAESSQGLQGHGQSSSRVLTSADPTMTPSRRLDLAGLERGETCGRLYYAAPAAPYATTSATCSRQSRSP